MAGQLGAVSTFDFDEEIERERAAAISERDRAGVRAAVSHQRLPEAVRAAGWHFLFRGDQFDPVGNPEALVIGVAPWNEAELKALGALQDRLAPEAVGVWVFDIDDCENADDIARFLPGAKPPVQTPVVAEYAAGGLTRSAEGSDALDLLTRLSR